MRVCLAAYGAAKGITGKHFASTDGLIGLADYGTKSGFRFMPIYQIIRLLFAGAAK